MSKSSSEKPLVLTLGDPRGIGPEIIAKALSGKNWEQDSARFVIIGQEEAMTAAWGQFGHGPLPVCRTIGEVEACQERTVLWSPAVDEGTEVPEAAWIRLAAENCLEGRLSAMVTAPICKESMYIRGYGFPGHTEYLAALTGSSFPVMMFSSPTLKVSLVTVHERLADVPARLSVERVLRTIVVTHQGMRVFFGQERPRLAICGLNPHAGEGGHLGTDESEHIVPAVEEARRRGIDAQGPFPADTLFARAAAGEFDIVVAQYHDQGLIPVKLLSFGDSVNVTFGIPIIRTSVDHGVAFDIAGRGVASPKSMISAIGVARSIVASASRMAP